jgi:hypothetical protein
MPTNLRRTALFLLAALTWIPASIKHGGLLQVMPLILGSVGFVFSILYLVNRKRSGESQVEQTGLRTILSLELCLFAALVLTALFVWMRR